MPGRTLLERQVAKATNGDGEVDYCILRELVTAAYNDKELDRRRADRASRLVAEELEITLADLEVQNLRFKAALDNMSQGLCLFDASGHLVVCNQRFRDIFRLPDSDSFQGKQLFEILDASPCFGAADDMERRLLSIEYEFLDKTRGASKEQSWPDGRAISIVRTPTSDRGFLDTIEDVTENRLAAEQIAHLAHHDALTDLPNRVLLRERLSEAVQAASRDQTFAVLCLDLDRFKLVNDTLGHPFGDALLIEVGKRLRTVVRESDTVARLGGDEFAVVQRLLPSSAQPEILASRIIGVLSRPYVINGQEVQIGVSVGLDRIEGNSINPDELLRNADLALYRAKSEGRGCYKAFEPGMHAHANHRRQLELDLRAAIESRQFEVHYQPQVDLKSGRISGFEALVRWRHPTRGLVPPIEFVSMCEEVGLIDQLGGFVLSTACRDAMTWPTEVMVAVNLSANQFRTGKLQHAVESALRASGLDAKRLELEITEGVMLADTPSVLAQLRHLKHMGVHISLDDFGTGYSSLSYVRNFPFDKIKIDQSFVRELGVSTDSLAIIRAVAGMCSSLGIATTAEGVETDDQLRILTAERCDSVQGYLFGKAVPIHETVALFDRMPFSRAA